jgi:exopolysaccharide biosynthesis polyprenyl glycosylphosphotransferase
VKVPPSVLSPDAARPRTPDAGSEQRTNAVKERQRWATRLLVTQAVADAVVVGVCWIAAYAFRFYTTPLFGKPLNPLRGYIIGLPVVVAMWSLLLAVHGLYRSERFLLRLGQFQQLLKAALVGVGATMGLSFLIKELDFGRAVVLIHGLLALPALWILRTIMGSWVRRDLVRGRGLLRCLVVGTGQMARMIADKMRRSPEIGYELVGLVTTASDAHGDDVIGTVDDLPQLISRTGAHEVFVAAPEISNEDAFNLMLRCEHTGASFKIISDLFGLATSRVVLDEVSEVPVIHLTGGLLSPGSYRLKRALDIVVAVAAAVVSLPILPLIVVLIRLDSRGPAVLAQTRVGQAGRTFRMFKFRTMRRDVDPFEEAPRGPRDPRVTRVGRFLRRTSLDELPQLLNVFAGDMSMVGPRPEMPFLAESYTGWQASRLRVKPGLTGLWQVMGRKDLPLHENLEYDFYYIRNQSLLLDLTVLLKTIPVVLLGRGAY